jgi:hypothetical protein
MATRLATQRNYITVTPITTSQQPNNTDAKSNSNIMNTNSPSSSNEIVTVGTTTIHVEPNGTTATTADVLQHVLRQVKLN